MGIDISIIEQEIISRLGSGQNSAIGKTRSKGQKHATDLVKQILLNTGREFGFKAYSSSDCHEFDGPEWLYDVTWHATRPPISTRQILVAECEWNYSSIETHAEINKDFQKLVQARADFRLWVTAMPNPDYKEKHLRNCFHQIASFEQTAPDDRYIFCIYDWTLEHLETKIVRAGSLPLK